VRVITKIVAKKPARPVSYPVTDQWRRDILNRMEALGVTQAELARQVGCKEPTLTVLFRDGGTQKTKLMAAIHDVLKLPAPTPPGATIPPTPPPVDPVDAELTDVIARLDDTWKKKLLSIAKDFPSKSDR
jgi:transcriptional regulator with XRE-family HTH domain